MAKISFKNVGEGTIKVVTPKAVRVEFAGEVEHWFPKSTLSTNVRNDCATKKDEGKTIEKFMVEEWFLEKEEIPFNEES